MKKKIKQTAVEWLFEKIMDSNHDDDLYEILEQAKAMEKEQIVNALNDGWNMAKHSNFVNSQAEQYYNEIYGK
jgi:hypothetical protein